MVEASVIEVSTVSTEVRRDADLLAIVADPNRLALLRALTSGTTCVCELQQVVPIAANLLSYHLKVLRGADLVTGTRRGRWIDYTLNDDALARLHAALPSPVTPRESLS
jgi:ArsR family transcriptional regulator, arsenate/arsenite/antimonite-responsive transcriptional repressor